ncbi:MAG TPA: ABC transporter substrate-binding protein [Xanthobacteraceae bacterium]|jgi:putative ABC transport system substrate-binding protein
MQFDRLLRREFIGLLSGAAAWPFAARAQQPAMQPAMPVIGFLGSGSAAPLASRLRAFRQGLGEMGYVEGRNPSIEYRWAEGKFDRLATFAADLVARNVAVIFASDGLAAPAAKAATTKIPIVFNTASDPVQAELVTSLSRPGGNITGVTNLGLEVAQKRLELLHEMVPVATRIALLVNPSNPNAVPASSDMQAAARSLGLELQILRASTERDLDTVFANLAQQRAGALVIGTDPFFTSHVEQLAALTARHSVPAIFQAREFTAVGGLMSYGGSVTDSFHSAGVYVGRVLKGEKPADLPVQQVTKVELFINLKTAKALGLTVPLPLLGRANEVIE